MKKTILQIAIFVAGILMAITSASAQEGFQLGAQVVPQFSWLMNQDDADNPNFEYLSTMNGAFGINSQYGFTPDIAIGLDVLYSFQGQRFKLAGIEQYKNVEYVKVPVMFIYNYQASENFKVVYKIGPQLGLLTNATLLDKDGDEIVSDHKAAYMDMDFGGVASIGIAVKLMNNLFFDAAVRYDYGFTNAEDDTYHDNVNNPVNGNGGSVSSNRAITNNMTAGLVIGLRCLLSNTNNE